MARLVRLVRYLVTLLLLFGMLSLSHVIVPELGVEFLQPWLSLNQTEDFWLDPDHTKPATNTELFIPGCMYLGPPTLKGIVDRLGQESTFAAIGEVTRIRVFRDARKMNPYSIAYFRTHRALTPDGPGALKFYSPFAVWRTEGNTYRAVGVGGYDCTKGLEEGDEVLVVLHRGQAGDWGLDSRLEEVWRPLTLWYLKAGSNEGSGYLYQLGDSRDLYRLDASMSAKAKRVFVTDGRTVDDGIESVRLAYGEVLAP